MMRLQKILCQVRLRDPDMRGSYLDRTILIPPILNPSSVRSKIESTTTQAREQGRRLQLLVHQEMHEP